MNALCGEIELRKNYFGEKRNIETIYFGGGTPSLLTTEELNRIFEVLSKNFTWEKNAEITLECNPDDLTKEKLTALKLAGINRLSIGLQSFNEEELTWMNRAHTAMQSEQSVKDAQDAGFNNITIDLIYGSKFQDVKSWEETLRKATSLKVQHISAYNLTVEKRTALGVAVERRNEPLVDDEKSAAQFLLMMDVLGSKDFIHYEISNFAQKNFESRHNSNYWKGSHYLGIGPSAHSFNGTSRQWNVSNNAVYIKGIKRNEPVVESETLSKDDKYNEYILTCLRTIWGCDLQNIQQQFGDKYADHFKENINRFIPAYVKENNSIYTLTRDGKLLADKIATDLFT